MHTEFFHNAIGLNQALRSHHNELGQRRHYRLEQNQLQHFEETSGLAKVQPEVSHQAFGELVEAGLSAGFSDRVAGPIIAHAKN